MDTPAGIKKSVELLKDAKRQKSERVTEAVKKAKAARQGQKAQ